MILDRFLERAMPGQPNAYQRLVMRAYAEVVTTILAHGLPNLIRGLYHAALGHRDKRIEEFLDGSVAWGETVRRFTRTRVVRYGNLDCPPSGHLILLNHVNEIDFAFDCLMLRKPYLANAAIKDTFFAYWWMLGMGSMVFDHRQARTIPASVRALVKALDRRSYVVYPEGKNSYGEEVQPLRKGMLKIAFDKGIPCYIVLKSGLAAFRERQRGNVVGYTALGTVQPRDFPTWTAFRDHIHERMTAEKPRLDERVAAETAADRGAATLAAGAPAPSRP